MPNAALGGEDARAGSQVLSLFANALNLRVLRAHAEKPLRLTQLQQQISWAAQTTLRMTIANLRDFGVLAKRQIPGTPYAVENELTPAGEEMLLVADVLTTWLARAPDGPIDLDSSTAKSAIKALVGGWSSSLMRAIASRPLTLTELNQLLTGISYPSLERRLTQMRLTSQIEPVPAQGRGTPYVATEWLRRSIAPLFAAGRWEQHHMKDRSRPVTGTEVEAALLLSVPLVSLPTGAAGACLLAAVQTSTDKSPEDPPALAGVNVEVQGGQLVSTGVRTPEGPSNWALGTPEAWLNAIVVGDVRALRVGGSDPHLALDLAHGIHFALFSQKPNISPGK